MVGADDLTLVEQAQRGDRVAFGVLVERYQVQVYNVAFRITGDRAEAEDVAQNVFLKVYENLASFDPRRKLFSWIYRIAINEALNAERRRKSHEGLEEQTASLDTPVDRFDRAEIIQASLLALKPEYRAVLVLRHFQDLSYEQIGEALGIPVRKVRSRLFTARALLRELLERRGLQRGD